ncbi:MAG: hypothetical protein R2941_14530 [Desulfobacterales bacterium]
MGIGTIIDLEKICDLRFADLVCPEPRRRQKAFLFHDPKEILKKI